MDELRRKKRNIKAIAFFSILFFILIAPLNLGIASQVTDFGGFIPLTLGTTSTALIYGNGSTDLTMVLCLSTGTLTVSLKKEDTYKDMVTMLIYGLPANPALLTNVGATPTTISSSTAIDNTLGGIGWAFIFSGVFSDREPPYKYTITVKLAAAQ
jgi:hypothetical protein